MKEGLPRKAQPLESGTATPRPGDAAGHERLRYLAAFNNGLVASSFFPFFKRLLDFLAAM
jgi:hypothetical protein